MRGIRAERHQRKRLPFFAQRESRAKARILRGDFADSSLRSGNICIISDLVAERTGFEPGVRFVWCTGNPAAIPALGSATLAKRRRRQSDNVFAGSVAAAQFDD